MNKELRMKALSQIHLWDAPMVVYDYLKTGNEDLRDIAFNLANKMQMDLAWDAAEAMPWNKDKMFEQVRAIRIARDAAKKH